MLATLLVLGCSGTPAETGGPPDVDSSPRATVAAIPSATASAAAASIPLPTVEGARPHWESVAPPTGLHPLTLQAVLLRDGRALFLSNGEEDARVHAALWSPETAAWQETAGLDRPRTAFASIALDDGRALVVGGYNESGQSYSSVYAYDPLANTWTKAGVMGAARTNPAVATLGDGRVLIVGGYYYVPAREGSASPAEAKLAGYQPAAPPVGPTLDDVDVPPHGYALATAEIYDPRTGSFTETEPMRYARPGPSIATLRDGRVLVVGATLDDVTGIDSRAFETAEIFDPETGRFEPAGTLPGLDRAALEQPGANPVPDEDPTPGSVGELAALADGGALLVAHSGWWKHVGEVSRSFRFDPAPGTWREIGETYIYVGEPTADVLYAPGVPWLEGVLVATTQDEAVLRAGGRGPTEEAQGGGYFQESTAAAALFDASTDTWLPLPDLPQPREGGVAVRLQDDSVLLVGGFTSTQAGADNVPPVRFVPTP